MQKMDLPKRIAKMRFDGPVPNHPTSLADSLFEVSGSEPHISEHFRSEGVARWLKLEASWLPVASLLVECAYLSVALLNLLCL